MIKRLIFCIIAWVCFSGPHANMWAGIGTNNCTPPSGCTQSVPSCGRIFNARPGSWSTNTGWTGTYPGQQAGDCVVIPNNITVTYDVTTAQPNPIARILINGTGVLKFQTGTTGQYILRAYLIGVSDDTTGGTLQIGSPGDLFGGTATIMLYGMPRACYTSSIHDYQPCNGGIQVNQGGTWTSGISPNLTYQAPLALDTTILPSGPNTILVTGDLRPPNGWSQNDLLVISSTEFREGTGTGFCPVCPTVNPPYSCGLDENELLSIAPGPISYDSANNRTSIPITRISPPILTNPPNSLIYRHKSKNDTVPPLAAEDLIPAQVGKLNRNIKIMSDPASTENRTIDGNSITNLLLPSSILISPQAANLQISDVEFYNLGVPDAVQLFPGNTLNQYALHIHGTFCQGTPCVPVVKPRSVVNSGFHTDYLTCPTGYGSCKPSGLNSPYGGFNSQLVLHTVRNATIDHNVFYNPTPFPANGTDGASLWAPVPSSQEVDDGIFSNNLTLTNNVIATDNTSSCAFGVSCSNCPNSGRIFPSTLYVQSAKHRIDNNFSSGGYYGFYGVITPSSSMNPTDPTSILSKCQTQDQQCQTPPCATDCDMISFFNNVATAAVNDNFRYNDMYAHTAPGRDPNNRINTLNTFGSYAGSAGITFLTSPSATAFPQAMTWTGKGFYGAAKRSWLPLGVPVVTPDSPSRDRCSSDPPNCPNQVFARPYQGPPGDRVGIMTTGEVVSGLVLWNDFNVDATGAAILVVFNTDASGACVPPAMLHHNTEVFHNVTFRPDHDPTAAVDSNKVMAFACAEDQMTEPPSCMQFCNFSMALANGNASLWFPTLAAAVGQPNASYINFNARPKKSTATCEATYGLNFHQVAGFDNQSYVGICVGPLTGANCPLSTCPQAPSSRPLR